MARAEVAPGPRPASTLTGGMSDTMPKPERSVNLPELIPRLLRRGLKQSYETGTLGVTLLDCDLLPHRERR